MTKYFPVVVEREENGSFSAWIPGMPGVYAAADTRGEAKRAIRSALAAHLATLEGLGRPINKIETAELAVLKFAARKHLQYGNLASTLLGRRTSPAKARAARINGRKGGRPARAR